MTRKTDRDWGRYGSALAAFKAGADESPFARVGIAAIFVNNLFGASYACRVGKGHDTLLFDAARETIRMFRNGFEKSAIFKSQSYSIKWDFDAYQTVARELAAEMANSEAVEEAVTDRLQEARWALFTDNSITHDDPRFFIKTREVENIIPVGEKLRDDRRFGYLKYEPLAISFSRTWDSIEEEGLIRSFYEARRQIAALSRIGQAMFGYSY